MDIPVAVDAWTFETVERVVATHEYEPGRFEYKEVLNASGQGKGDHIASIRRATCSMANGDGGYIVFGVKDRQVSVATPTDRIVGIPRAPDLRKQFGEKLSLIERDVYWDAHAIDMPQNSTQCIFVVHIPTSTLRPHIDRSDGRFLVRGEGGSAQPMSFIQVRDQMLYTEGRLQETRLLRWELAAFREVVNMLLDPVTRSVRFDAGPYKALLADICDLLTADPNLLTLLYTIGKEATILNPLLDKREELMRPDIPTILPGGIAKGNAIADIYSRCIVLSNSCGKAMERLSILFGPLDTP